MLVESIHPVRDAVGYRSQNSSSLSARRKENASIAERRTTRESANVNAESPRNGGNRFARMFKFIIKRPEITPYRSIIVGEMSCKCDAITAGRAALEPLLTALAATTPQPRMRWLPRKS